MDAAESSSSAAITADRAAPSTQLRVGILAPEFTVQHGGMQVLARELISQLANRAECHVVARADRELPASDVPVLPILRNNLAGAAGLLAPAGNPNVWLALNAGMAALAPHLGAPLVTYVNGNDLLEPWFGFEAPLIRVLDRLPRTYRITRAMRRRAYRMSALAGTRASQLLIANSTNTRWLVEQHLGTRHPTIRVVEPGVSDSFFQSEQDARRRSRVAGTPLRLLTVSRLSSASRRKNVDGMLRAVASLPPGVVAGYTIVGDGDDRSRLERLAMELGIGDRVRFTGPLRTEDILELYAEADLFMLASSATDRDVEGFGIVYMEASASGVPSLGSRTGGAVDAIVEGKNGLLVQDSSPLSIAAGIVSVFEKRVDIDPAAAREVAERFRWSAVADRILAALQSVAR